MSGSIQPSGRRSSIPRSLDSRGPLRFPCSSSDSYGPNFWTTPIRRTQPATSPTLCASIVISADTRILRKLLREVASPEESFTLLDVGAASGDTAETLKPLFPNATVVSLDFHEVNLRAAPTPKLVADAFALPFRPASFDFVFCSLFLHHFPDAQVGRFTTGFLPHRPRGLSWFRIWNAISSPTGFSPATRRLFDWHWITTHDGPVSVQAAFTANELKELARAAGIPSVRTQIHRPASAYPLSRRKRSRKRIDQ